MYDLTSRTRAFRLKRLRLVISSLDFANQSFVVVRKEQS
jgi:hypothetical protein